MSGQTTRHWMYAEPHLLTRIPQQRHTLSQIALTSRHRHTVARYDDDRLGLLQQTDDTVHFDDVGGVAHVGRLLRLEVGGGSEAAQYDIGEAAIHRSTHYVRQDRTAAADQTAGDNEQITET